MITIDPKGIPVPKITKLFARNGFTQAYCLRKFGGFKGISELRSVQFLQHVQHESSDSCFLSFQKSER